MQTQQGPAGFRKTQLKGSPGSEAKAKMKGLCVRLRRAGSQPVLRSHQGKTSGSAGDTQAQGPLLPGPGCSQTSFLSTLSRALSSQWGSAEAELMASEWVWACTAAGLRTGLPTPLGLGVGYFKVTALQLQGRKEGTVPEAQAGRGRAAGSGPAGG